MTHAFHVFLTKFHRTLEIVVDEVMKNDRPRIVVTSVFSFLMQLLAEFSDEQVFEKGDKCLQMVVYKQAMRQWRQDWLQGCDTLHRQV